MDSILGFIGAFLLAFCALPQVIAVWKEPNKIKGLDTHFLWSWFCGIVCMWAYYIILVGFDIPTMLNYGLNSCLSGYLFYAKLKEMHYSAKRYKAEAEELRKLSEKLG